MKVELNINDEILKYGKFSEMDIKMMLGVSLYNNNVTSTGKTAEILGIDRVTFLEEMGKYGGLLFDDEIENILKRSKND